MEIRENTILFLIGAGCSKAAGIKISNEMVDDIDNLIRTNTKWKDYSDLYFYLRSSIQFSEGIFGKFNEPFNIEKLLSVMSELEKRDRNVMYPFIGNWNNRLIDIAGSNFSAITKLKTLINNQLFNWININSYSGGDYYHGFGKFKKEIGVPLKIFSLNYDLFFEEILGSEFEIELGFNPTDKKWSHSNFQDDDKRNIHFYLYKLHGSIDWQRNGKDLIKCDKPVQDSELIFGTASKLKSIDPFLFYVFEFRKWSLEQACKLIVTIGYSYSDDYINGIIAQALNKSEERKLISVSPFGGKSQEDVKKNILNALENFDEHSRIDVVDLKAEQFLSDKICPQFFEQYMPEDKDSPF